MPHASGKSLCVGHSSPTFNYTQHWPLAPCVREVPFARGTVHHCLSSDLEQVRQYSQHPSLSTRRQTRHPLSATIVGSSHGQRLFSWPRSSAPRVREVPFVPGTLVQTSILVCSYRCLVTPCSLRPLAIAIHHTLSILLPYVHSLGLVRVPRASGKYPSCGVLSFKLNIDLVCYYRGLISPYSLRPSAIAIAIHHLLSIESILLPHVHSLGSLECSACQGSTLHAESSPLSSQFLTIHICASGKYPWPMSGMDVPLVMAIVVLAHLVSWAATSFSA